MATPESTSEKKPTEAMIRTGVSEFVTFDERFEDAKDVVERIYVAMIGAKSAERVGPRNRRLQARPLAAAPIHAEDYDTPAMLGVTRPVNALPFSVAPLTAAHLENLFCSIFSLTASEYPIK